MQELDIPPRHLVEAMSSVKIPPSAAVAHQPEDWCKQMCKHGELFSQVVLCASSLTRKRFFYFCYATQSPQEIVLAPLAVRSVLGLHLLIAFVEHKMCQLLHTVFLFLCQLAITLVAGL